MAESLVDRMYHTSRRNQQPNYRLLQCALCRFIGHRDAVASINFLYAFWHEFVFGFSPFRPAKVAEEKDKATSEGLRAKVEEEEGRVAVAGRAGGAGA